MSEQRDKDLGARLDELEVQEHGPEYWSAVMANAEPEMELLRAAAADEPAVERHPTFGGSFKWWATAAVAAVVALVLLLGGLPGGEHGRSVLGPQPATAAEAIHYALGALDHAQAIEGTMYIGKTRKGVYSAGDKVTFLQARDGSFRVSTRTVGRDTLLPASEFIDSWVAATYAYDASARRSKILFDYGAKGTTVPAGTQDPSTGELVVTEKNARYVYTEQADVPPAYPDRDIYDPMTFPIWQVRAYLRTMLGDPRVRFATGEIDGHKVWLLTTEGFAAGSPGKAAQGSSVTIAIDAQSRLPLRFTAFRGAFEVRIAAAALSGKPAAGEFNLPKPPPAETNGQSGMGFSAGMRFPGLPFGDAASMRKVVDDLPAFPGWVPRGFSLQAGASQNGFFDVQGNAVYSRQSMLNTIVSLAFRRGFDAAYVTLRRDVRLSGKATTSTGVRIDTSDPFVGYVLPRDREQWRTHTTNVRLKTGSFKGAMAHVVVDPGYWPHLWVKKDGRVATVAGDLSQAQMIRIAESLGPWNASGGE